MKIKVATSFSYRSDSRDGAERYISSAVTIEPDDDQSVEEYDDERALETTYTTNLTEKPCLPSGQELTKKFSDVALPEPRFMIIGKPCTGKTTLAKQLCKQFGCELVNATELIEENLRNQTEIGRTIQNIMVDGRDLDDEIVLRMLAEKLQSPNCIKNGYVLDGIPTHSENALSIERQLDFICALENPPVYVLDIKITNEELRGRWEDMKIDYKDGHLYPKESYDFNAQSLRPGSPVHPDFPLVDSDINERLLTRHEEISENLDQHFAFYDSKVQNKVDDFMSRYDPSSVISLDGHISPTERFEVTMNRLKTISNQSQDGTDTRSRTPVMNSERLQITDSMKASFKADKTLWIGHAPRLVVFGRPGIKKRILVKALCDTWDCEYVNVADIIQHQVVAKTPRGLEIISILSQGEQLPDEFLIEFLMERLSSPDCRQNGYIIEGLPTYGEDALSIKKQIEFLEQLYPEPYFWVVIRAPETGSLQARPTSFSSDICPGTPDYSCELSSLDEEIKRRLLVRREELPENLETLTRFYKERVEEPLGEFISRCAPKSVIWLDGTLSPYDLGLALIAAIRATIDECGLKASAPRPKNYLPTLAFPQEPNPDTDVLSSTRVVDSVGSFENVETPRSAVGGAVASEDTGSENRQMPTEYKGFAGEFHLRTQYRSTTSNASQISDTEQNRMATALGTMGSVPSILSKSSGGNDMAGQPNTSEVAIRTPALRRAPESEQQKCCCHCGARFAEMPDDILRARWESVKIDLESGILYTDTTYKLRSGSRHLVPTCCVTIPDDIGAPNGLPEEKRTLIKRFEELSESMDNNITFYHEVVEPQVREWLDKYHADNIISMDGDMDVNEIFYMLHQKISKILDNPNTPPRLLFMDKANSFVPGSCCRRCGARYTNLERQPDLWPDDPPRIAILGKPCTGKTTLARRLCAQWNCQLINATDLMQEHLNRNTATGQRIREILCSGADLSDHFVVNMLLEKLSSPGCTETGYVIDGIPTHSEKSHSIASQLDFLRSIVPPPDYLFVIEIPDAALRERWQTIRIDVADGTLYTTRMFGNLGRHPSQSRGRCTRHADFPELDDKTRQRLITRHEELPENLDRHFQFYNDQIAPQLREFIRQHNPAKLVILDGEQHADAMVNCFKALYTSHVRPRLEFASAAAYSYTTAEMVKLERVQRAATRMIAGLRGCCYTKRLHATGLFPESYRRVRGDICVRRILRGDMGSDLMEYFPLREQTRTRGHGLTLLKLSSTLLYKLNVMARNPNVPTAELFAEPPRPGHDRDMFCNCPHHNHMQVEPIAELWTDKPPRVLIVGKPCTGKTTLAKRLCAAWNCELINASEMIRHALETKSDLGRSIRENLVKGYDLNDHLILELLRQAINSPAAMSNGYILDGLPTHSEMVMSVPDQLQFLRKLENGPDYIIEIQMADDKLRNRWEAIRIDVADGTLYSRLNYDRPPAVQVNGRRTRHPDFPIIDEQTKDRLLTRHEELAENLDRHFEFYHQRIDEPLKQHIASHDPSMVVRVNGDLSPTQLFQSVLLRLSIMSRHPGVDTAVLFPTGSGESGEAEDSSHCECGDADGAGFGRNRMIWQQDVPRVMIVGNSCSGKTTLAKRLCKEWGCVLVNASELITQHLNNRTALGDQFSNILRSGKDLPDDLVLHMIHNKLISDECNEMGYVLDDFPTSSEKGLSIGRQLEMLNGLPFRPEFIIQINIPENDLRQRWEAMRMDIADGALYASNVTADTRSGSQAHPRFPTPTAKQPERLITRYEELTENVNLQNRFYQDYVQPQIAEFIQQYPKEFVITVDGTDSPANVFRSFLQSVQSDLNNIFREFSSRL
ncbi:unnamed protein product [Echinostoma caproni]|uniref:Nucleoside-diphosphate kinase n=1 Tax=Echinostoma caproni TaxID=27848 RepID=A0A183A8S4_9TREM|nr:unnamed protein product [Echinostoma caproni]